MSALTSGKLFFPVFEKQAKRIMSDTESTSCPPPTLVHDKYYRVWSLTSQGFLTLKPKDGGKCGEKFADFSGTGKENSSE